MRTKIDLGSSGIIDLTDDVAYAITYAIADIRNPEKRNASYSKTIKIPGSPNNDYIFRFIFEIDIDCNFNPNKKALCTLCIDEIPQITGYLQLLTIYRNENKIEYEVAIIGEVGNIFTEWGEKYLSDLDYSDLNHYLLKSIQEATWTSTPGQRYVYPMIDLGNGYNGMRYNVEDFYPALYVKEYIDRMFKYAGYTYSSTFFNTDYFKRLIIPYNGKGLGLSIAQITERKFVAYRSGNITKTPTSSTMIFTAPFNAESSDVSNQYDTTLFRVTIGTGFMGDYTFVINQDINDHYIHTTGAIGADTTSQLSLLIKRIRAGVTTVVSVSTYDINHIGLGTTPNDSYVTTINHISLPIRCYDGDIYYVEYRRVVNVGSSTGDYANPNNWQLKLSTGGTFYNNIINDGLFEGQLLDFTQAIPDKIMMKDFFKSICQMFNLYIQTDKDYHNLLHIEPRNDFYLNGEVVDWSDKLDTMQDLEIQPMGDLDSVKYRFAYKEDSDYWNTKYKNAWQKTYSELNYIIDNDFLKNTNDNELIFSPTPQVNVYGLDRIIPQIISVDNVGTITKTNGFNIRILYYGGVKTTTNPWTYMSVIELNSDRSIYPYCGMVDDVDTPDEMLDFGVPVEVFYDTNVYSNNNLFNKYYKQFIEEITDKDSKIVTGLFALTPLDILKLDFRNEFYINGNIYRLNKIYDYNPIAETLTKCEFIKIKYANAFVKKRVIGTGVDSVFSLDNPLPRPSRPFLPIVTSVISPDNSIHPSVIGAVVTGTGNVISAGVENPTILGSSGVIIASGVRSPIVIGTNDILVDRDNVVIVNGVDLTASSGIVTNGTYTPTIYNVLNVTSSSAHVCNYARNGSMVVVSGSVTIVVTLGGWNTQFGMSLPITSAFTAPEQAGGTGAEESGLYVASIQATPPSPRVAFRLLPGALGSIQIFFIFQYQII